MDCRYLVLIDFKEGMATLFGEARTSFVETQGCAEKEDKQWHVVDRAVVTDYPVN